MRLSNLSCVACLLALLTAAVAVPIASDEVGGAEDTTRLRVMAANISSGRFQSYPNPGPGVRIFQALQPDVVLIQEFNVNTRRGGANDEAAVDRWVDDVFGTDYHWFREPGGDSIPNGVISRWPIVESGEWNDASAPNRDFAFTRIDLPGATDLWAVSLHLLTRNSRIRDVEAAALVEAMRRHPVPEEDYLIVGGDLNTSRRDEPALTTLGQVIDTLGPFPSDGNDPPDGDTNSRRRRPYDWVLTDSELEARTIATVVGDFVFPEGLVFDSRIFTEADLAEAFAPVLRGDSDAPQMQHMAVVRDFGIGTASGPGVEFTLSATEVDFGSVELGSGPVEDSSIQVRVAVPFSVTAVAFSGSHPAEFSLMTPDLSAGPVELDADTALTFAWTPAADDSAPRRVRATLITDGEPGAFEVEMQGVITAAPPPPSGLLLTNGRVYTVDERQPWAEAVAITGDRIVAVGSGAEVRAAASPGAREIDLGGAFVMPGFNDAHVHVDSTGALLTGVNLLDVHEPDAFADRIREATERLPPGSWIVGGDWGAYEDWGEGSSGQAEAATDSTAESAGPFTPHRDLIDALTPDHPVLLSRFDRSVYLANRLALEAAGIDEVTADPDRGEIGRDGSGRLTGLLTGTAVDLVRDVIPPVPFEQRLVQVRSVLDEARRGGVTTIQDITSAEQLLAYQELQRRGELTARIMVRPIIDQVTHVAALGIGAGFGNDWLKVVGFKGWVDGIMGNSSAMFFADYDHDPGNRGRLRPPMLPESVEGAAFGLGIADHYTVHPPGNMERLLFEWLPTGVPPHIHAIGDLGNRILLDIFERVLSESGRVDSDHRWRVIHAQVLHPADVERFGRLNLVAEVNPYHVSDDMRWMEERIGPERSRGAYAFRDLAQAGAVLIFGSDAPGTNAARYYLNPVYGLYAAVSRQTLGLEPAAGWFPHQRLTIEEAIEAYTKAPAWACFEEDDKGTLSVGKLADLAVFDTDLVDAGRNAPATLLEARVLYTIAGGEVVFKAQ